MLKSRHIDLLCWIAAALAVGLAALFFLGACSGLIRGADAVGYEARIFDTARVHTVDLVMDDWETFLSACTGEAYSACTAVIDGEKYANVGIRGKGNTSLSSVAAYGNDRYSFKLEFDHYEKGKSYYGLDKLNLNNLFADNTYMKDYLCYTMMRDMGVAAPLCSFVQITVNGEAWGLYLAVEGVEDSFLERNGDSGALYKPDSMRMGGGAGNGRDFAMEDFFGGESAGEGAASGVPPMGGPAMETGEMPGGFGGMGSADVKLQYIDDDPASYANIFDNAKTDVTQADQSRLIAALKTLSGENAAAAVDTEAVLRYFVVHDFVCNGDSYTGSMIHNYYLYEEDGVLSMIPWDYNLAFGGFENMGGGAGDATATVNAPIDSPVADGDIASRPMIAWIFASEEYTALYHQYYAEFMEKYFAGGYFETLLAETAARISPYVESDPTAFCTYDEFLSGVEALRTFCLLRAQSVEGQLAGTIPSTEEGQAASGAARIDASVLDLTAMGTFSGGGGQGLAGREGMEGMGGPGAPGERPAGMSEGMPEGMPAGTPPELPPGMSGMTPGTMGRPVASDGAFPANAMPGAAAETNGATQWLLLGGCALLLAICIFLVRRYRRL